MEERGAGGGTVRLWSAVPSPGHKKAKNFKLNQGITKNLNFISLSIIHLFLRGRNHLKRRSFLPRLPCFLGWAPLKKYSKINTKKPIKLLSPHYPDEHTDNMAT